LKPSQEIWKIYLPYLAIAGIIFIFNAISIWGFDGLMTDDQGYYFRLYDKTIDDLHFSRNIIHALFTLGIIKLATISSVYFARLVILLLLSIPCAFLVYHFARHEYHLRKHSAIAVAVLPFILPNEVQVPTYIVGSYMLPGLLAALISIWFILKYSKIDQFSVAFFVLSAVFYYLATECTELLATMVPAFLFLVFACRKLTWKQVMLGAALLFISVRKSYLVISHPYGNINSIENKLSINDIIYRVVHFPDYINPLFIPGKMLVINTIVIILIIFAAAVVFRNRKWPTGILDSFPGGDNFRNKYFYLLYYFGFPLVWIAFSALPFLFFSESFTSRYFALASVGSSFLLVISLGILTGLFTTRKMPFVLVSVILIGFAGISRQVSFNRFFQPHREQFRELGLTLGACNMPGNSQIIVTTSTAKMLKLGNGVTNNSNGVFQYILERRDVKGQVMKETSFYDPFHIYNQPYVYRNVDVDTLTNTFLFRCFNPDPYNNRRLYYALRWVDEKSRDSQWYIYQYDEQGARTNLVSGNGYDDYLSVVDSLSLTGIKREDIMFGGIPNQSDSLRLDL
jgi:hypothetical protein